MKKPDYLYHGSTGNFDILLPKQATGLPEENGDRYGVYAYADFEMARRFAIPLVRFPDGSLLVLFEEKTGKIIMSKGYIYKNSFGYVYKLNTDSFVQIDEYQWLSLEQVVPIETTIVYTADLWNMIEFDGDAKGYS